MGSRIKTSAIFLSIMLTTTSGLADSVGETMARLIGENVNNPESASNIGLIMGSEYRCREYMDLEPDMREIADHLIKHKSVFIDQLSDENADLYYENAYSVESMIKENGAWQACLKIAIMLPDAYIIKE